MTIDLAPENLDLAALIRPDDTVVCGQGGAEALTLTQALVGQRAAIGRLRVFLGANFAGTFRPEHGDCIGFTGYGGIGRNQDLARAGLLDPVPSHYSQLPALFADGTLRCDVVLLHLSPRDEAGRYNFGLAHDYTLAAARQARLVIAEINDRMPWTPGAELPADLRIDYAIHTSHPPAILSPPAITEVETRIGRHVAGLVPDGATIELGIGAIPEAVLTSLRDHRDLGLHSGMMGDGAAALVEAGVITNARKPIDRGVSIAGVLFGTRRLFDFAHRNPALRLCPPDYTHGIATLARLPGFVAINSAIEVDLTGQVNGEVANGVYLGAVGGQVDFVRAAGIVPGGRSIIALPATAKGGTLSRIVPRLADPVVTSLRSDMDAVVTEWGIAELRGCSLAERAHRMIAIAAPPFREALERAAAARGFD